VDARLREMLAEVAPQLGTVVAYSGPGLEITRPDAQEAN
jgi:diphosphomevalonate decarboxylase